MKATIVKTIIAAVVLAAIMLGPGERIDETTGAVTWCPAVTLGSLAALAVCGVVLRKLNKSRR